MRVKLRGYATLRLGISLCLALLSANMDADATIGRLELNRCVEIGMQSQLEVPLSFRKGAELELLRNGRILLEDRDYRLEADTVTLSDTGAPGDSICFSTQVFPPFPQGRWQVWNPADLPLAGARDTALDPIFNPEAERRQEVEASGIRYGGSKSFLLSVGDRGGLIFDQSLRLNLDGQVSENVHLEGRLHDDDVPIQPEGNTSTLKDVNEIYFRIFGPRYSFLLGDYLLQYGSPGVDSYTAQVRGGTVRWESFGHDLQASISISRGQYHTNTFQPREGQHKGYYLTGRNGESFIVVLAGTERVYRNGELLRRGEHYTIEYGEGRLDFRNTVRLSSENLIAVEFQYSEEAYPRSLSVAGVGKREGALRWNLRALHQTEDPRNPLRFALEGPERDFLSRIGDSLFLVEQSNIGADTALRGLPPPPVRHLSLVGELGHFRDSSHFSKVAWEGSYRDWNLYSGSDDSDNWGQQLLSTGKESLGDVFSEGGLGEVAIFWEGRLRGSQYQPFAQVLEPRSFREMWNLESQWAEKDFRAGRTMLEYKPTAWFAAGGEGGVAEGSRTPGPRDTSLVPFDFSMTRARGFARLGNRERLLLLETESKLGNAPVRRDNYRQHALGQWRWRDWLPTTELTRNEWLTTMSDDALARTIKEEGRTEVSATFVDGVVVNRVGGSGHRFYSNYDGRLGAIQDSSQHWEFWDGLQLAGLGPWFSELFVSRQYQRHWSAQNGSEVFRPAQPEESRFWTLEWNNQFSLMEMGLLTNANYSLSRRQDYPLVPVYDSVPEGTGNFVYEPQTNSFYENDVLGNYVLTGLARDTTVGRVAFEEKEFDLSFAWEPGRLAWMPEGVLRDIRLEMEMQLSQQDSAEKSVVPAWSDSELRRSLSGRSRFAPALNWSRGDRSAFVRTQRLFSKAPGIRAQEENLWELRTGYEQKWARNRFSLEQQWESSEKVALSPGALPVTKDVLGLEGRYGRLLGWGLWTSPGMGWRSLEGGVGTQPASLREWRPFIEMDRQGLFGGGLNVRYTLHYLQQVRGAVESLYFFTQGYPVGLTHEVTSTANFRIGESLYFHLRHDLRLHENADAVQKLSAEARAVF